MYGLVKHLRQRDPSSNDKYASWSDEISHCVDSEALPQRLQERSRSRPIRCDRALDSSCREPHRLSRFCQDLQGHHSLPAFLKATTRRCRDASPSDLCQNALRVFSQCSTSKRRSFQWWPRCTVKRLDCVCIESTALQAHRVDW